jgi:hypothetical protein
MEGKPTQSFIFSQTILSHRGGACALHSAHIPTEALRLLLSRVPPHALHQSGVLTRSVKVVQRALPIAVTPTVGYTGCVCASVSTWYAVYPRHARVILVVAVALTPCYQHAASRIPLAHHVSTIESGITPVDHVVQGSFRLQCRGRGRAECWVWSSGAWYRGVGGGGFEWMDVGARRRAGK